MSVQAHHAYTLALDPSRPGAPRRFVQLTLLERRGLLGRRYNVREVRAEPVGEGLEAGSQGRLLHWRWTARADASSILGARLKTLEALGYRVVEAGRGPRSGYAWLRELVRRQLHTSKAPARPSSGPGHDRGAQSPPPSEPTRSASPPTQDDVRAAQARESAARAQLVEAIERVGLASGELVEGLAEILELEPAALREPTAATLRRVPGETLCAMLPFMVEHEELREIAAAWLQLPQTLYEIPPESLEAWLRQGDALAARLAVRIPREGLALVGPEALARLERQAENADVRRFAAAWMRRTR